MVDSGPCGSTDDLHHTPTRNLPSLMPAYSPRGHLRNNYRINSQGFICRQMQTKVHAQKAQLITRTKQEKMSALSADMICGRPSSVAPSGKRVCSLLVATTITTLIAVGIFDIR